ncbi:hypothetical protein [Liquorilactobacillus capillatus]|uniref:Xaa-Pro dipeptidyl-peptidase C-terminal domain-containing protein n=1 Tax=Liquorilactobacillus capillatus DSM 19910 TaxID=1423731 RepID=A0A0R1LYE4_9LACO|nr:hypothetical protein [Liquorilactobacillus capillatus]KRL00606.1 hypothetical protein FC81_GL001963 [Liquorilactobacillus capillatus DSM 19910]
MSLKISLGTIVWRLKKGSWLVLLVSSSNFPMYAVHSNHEGEWSSQKIEANIASQTIYLGKDSYLKLPLSN